MSVGYCKHVLLNTYTVLLPIQTCETCRIIWIFQVLILVSGCIGCTHCMSHSCCFFTWFMLSSEHAYNAVFRLSTTVCSCFTPGKLTHMKIYRKVYNKKSSVTPWRLRLAVTGLSPWSLGFETGLIRIQFRFEIQL